MASSCVKAAVTKILTQLGLSSQIIPTLAGIDAASKTFAANESAVTIPVIVAGVLSCSEKQLATASLETTRLILQFLISITILTVVVGILIASIILFANGAYKILAVIALLVIYVIILALIYNRMALAISSALEARSVLIAQCIGTAIAAAEQAVAQDKKALDLALCSYAETVANLLPPSPP